jgi:outer membrane lipoprotein SlyB
MKSIVIAALLAFPSYGTVEDVREDELLLRLDDGRSITLVQAGMRFFQPDERVLVVPGRHGARVEHADGHPPFQP